MVLLLVNAEANENLRKPLARASSQGIELSIVSPAVQQLELNTQATLQVQLLSASQPVAAANIDWKITSTISNSSRQGAYFINGSSSFSNLETLATDENGLSQITLNAGEYAAAYSVTASVSVALNNTEVSLVETFTINAGIQASIITDTPESQVALTFDSLCPQLEENKNQLTIQQQALLDQCNAIQQAISEGKNIEVSKVLRQISPEEVAVQSVVGTGFGSQQASNIAARLNSVRSGTNQLSFSNLGFLNHGQSIPLAYMLNSLFAVDEDKSGETGSLLNNRLSLFASGNLSLGNRSATAREDGFEFDSYGITLGGDYRIRPTTFAGLALGVSKSEVQIAQSGGDLNANGFSLSGYGNHNINDQWYVDGFVSLGSNKFDMNRAIKFDLNNNVVNRTASSDTKGFQQAVSVGSGYQVYDGALSATFSGTLHFSRLNIDAFSETGAQELSLNIGKQTISSAVSSIGAQLQYTHSARWGILIPFISLSWQHEFIDDPNSITGSFASDQFNSSFTIKTEREDNNYFYNAQGITMVLPHGISAFIKMENVLGKDYYKITNTSFGGRMELQF